MSSQAAKRKQQKKAAAAKAAATPEIKSTLKDEGNKLFQDKKYDEAIAKFSQAIAEDPSNHVLYSNRSAVYNTIQLYDAALKDADEAVKLNPKWGKGWLRKGAAHEGLMQLSKAQEAYQQGLTLDPEDATLKKALDELSAMLEEMKQSHAEAALQDNPEGDRFQQMTEWLREGGAKFPYLYLQYYSEDYRGVHAATKVPNNKIVLEVPLSHIMTSDVAKASDIGKKIIASGCELGSSHSYLAAYLLQEKHNPNSFWKPYIRVLPEKYRNMPIFFDAPELQYLKGSFSIKKIQDRQEELKEEYDNICRHVPEFRKYTHDEFVWARLVVITRIFGLVVNGNKTDGLVPMADMLNHKRPRETSWTYDDSRGGFTITTLRALNRGEQIYDSYGRKCNSRFFVNYGFSLEENEDNQVALFVGLDDKDPQYPLKIRMLGEEGRRIGASKRRFQIPMDYKEKVTKECFSFLRFAHAKDSELMLLSSNEQEFNVNNIEPISIRNELEVIEHLADASKEILAGFDTTLEQDNIILKDPKKELTMNIRNAILMRRGEKEVLHYYIDLAKEMKPLIEMPWKDFKKYAAKCYSGTGRFDTYITSVIVPMKKNDH